MVRDRGGFGSVYEGEGPPAGDSGWARPKGAARRGASKPRGGVPREGRLPHRLQVCLCASVSPSSSSSSVTPLGAWLCSGRKGNVSA